MTDHEPLPLLLRAADAGDSEFIYDSWLKSYGDSAFAKDAGKAYWSDHPRLIERIVARAPVLVASWESEPDTILGWACTEGNVVHYVYVKAKIGRKGDQVPMRRRGIAKALLRPYLDAKDVVYTHRPPPRIRVPEGWTYRPHRAFWPESEAA